MTRQQAVELAPFGITVNAVAPGLVKTDINRDYLAHDEPYVRHVLAATPAGRLGTVDEIASAVLWLALPISSFITGQTIAVDGGWSIAG